MGRIGTPWAPLRCDQVKMHHRWYAADRDLILAFSIGFEQRPSGAQCSPVKLLGHLDAFTRKHRELDPRDAIRKRLLNYDIHAHL
jgi:hypothetical protein